MSGKAGKTSSVDGRRGSAKTPHAKSEATKARQRSEAAKKAAETRRVNALVDERVAAVVAEMKRAKAGELGPVRLGVERDIKRLTGGGESDLANGAMAQSARGCADALDAELLKPGERSTLTNTLRRAIETLERQANPEPGPGAADDDPSNV